MSLVKQLLERFKQKPMTWVASGAVETWVSDNTKYSPSNAKRRLREMAEEELIEVDYYKKNGVKNAMYRYNPDKSKGSEIKYSYHFDQERGCMVETRERV